MDVQKRIALASAIIGEHDSTIRAFIRCYVHNEHDMDDVYQNVFLSLVRTPPTTQTFLVAYLRQVIRNHATDLARRSASHNRLLSDYAECQEAEPLSLDPATRLMEAEQLSRTREFLESVLPSHMANVVTERCGRGNNTCETASKLGLKPRTVSHYYCVAMKRVRQLARDHGVQAESLGDS